MARARYRHFVRSRMTGNTEETTKCLENSLERLSRSPARYNLYTLSLMARCMISLDVLADGTGTLAGECKDTEDSGHRLTLSSDDIVPFVQNF